MLLTENFVKRITYMITIQLNHRQDNGIRDSGLGVCHWS